MQVPTTSLDVLYVGEDGFEVELAEQREFCVTAVTADSDQWPGAETVDCLLVDTVPGESKAVERVRRVRQTYPSTPLVAFARTETAGRVLEAGATDVVRSRPAETPETLLRQRIENVYETAPVPGVADHGSDTYEALLDHLSENLQDVVRVYNPDNQSDGAATFVSAAYEDVWGRPREHLLRGGTEAFYETVHPEDRERVRKVTRAAWLESGHTDVTYRILRPDGEIRWIHDRALGIREGPETEYLIGVSRDITERKKRKQELAALEESLQNVLSTVPVVFFAFDEDGIFTRSQGQALEHFNLEPGDVVGVSVFELFNSRPDICEHCRRALDGERVTATVEIAGRTFESRYQPVYDDNGTVVRVVGHSYDITERVEQQRKLERQNDLFTKAQSIADVGAWEYSFDGRSRWTQKVYDIFEIPEETEPALATSQEYYHEADWPRIEAALDRAREAGESFDLEVRIVTGTGKLRWVHLRGDPQTVDDEVVRIRGTIQDITERKEREQERKRNQEFLEQIQQVSDVGGWEYDFRSDELQLTDATSQLLDLPQGTLRTAEEVLECHHPDDRDQAVDAVTRLWSEGERFAIEVRVISGEGDIRWVYSQAEPVYEDGEVVAMWGVSRDITERKEREQQLQSERDIIERILETSPVGILVHDADLQITRANEQAATILDVEPGTLEGSNSPPGELEILSAAGEPRSEDDTAIAQAKQTGEPVHDLEFVVETPAGERRTVVADAVPLFDDGELQRVVSTFEDVTERVEREKRLTDQRNELERLDRINRIIRDVDAALVGAETRTEIEQAVCDQLSGSGPYERTILFRETGTELTAQTSCGVDDDTIAALPEVPRSALPWQALEQQQTQASQVGGDDDRWQGCQTLVDGDVRSMAAIPLLREGQTYGVLVVCSAETGAFHERELEVLGELGENVGYAISAVESREREATLTSLYEATQVLLAADNPQAVCDVVVDTAASVLDPPGVGIFLFDDEENVLEMAAGTDRLHEFYSEQREFGPGRADSVTWQTYVSRETQFFSDVRSSEHVANPDTEARTSLFLPLGEHGVFVVSADERVPFGEDKRQLIGLLGATTEAALDRVAGQESLREQDRRLRKRTGRLEQFEGLFSLVGDIDVALHRASTPEELNRGVCEQLVGTDPYEFAWMGTVPPDGTAIEPQTWADGETMGQAYLDEVSFALDGDTPAAQAARTGDPVCISNVTDHLRDADWARTAVRHDYESVLAVPLTHRDATYGVLTVYATTPRAFDGPARSVFDRLGTLVPDVRNRLQRDRTVLAERVVELGLSLPEPDAFPNAVAAAADEPVQYRQVRPTPDGRTRILFTLTDPPIEAVRDIERRFVTVESLDRVEQAGETTFRATLSGSTAATTLLSCGAIPCEVVAHPDRTTVTVRLPHDTDVRQFLDRVDDHYPGTELDSRRDVSVRDDADAPANRALAEDLTDRQREVLRTAYEYGFFESPRATTGVELADLLDVSQPTVTHHLREAQRRLFDALFEAH